MVDIWYYNNRNAKCARSKNNLQGKANKTSYKADHTGNMDKEGPDIYHPVAASWLSKTSAEKLGL